MRITVDHSTVYRYGAAVYLDPHTFRLRPRMSSTQWLLSFEMHILPTPSGTTECLDQDGNLALHAWFQGPVSELSVRSRFCVKLYRENPFDFFITGSSLQLPLWYPNPISEALVPYRKDAHIAESVKQFATALAAGAQWNLLAFLIALNRQIFQTFRPITRLEGPPWTSDLTLNRMEGSCRDLAVLFCDACRVVGIAARFVSGYECAASRRPDAYMHAWAEVYLPTVGWRGDAPSRGLAVANEHVAVAAGSCHDLAAPVSGTFSGATWSHMDTSICRWIRSTQREPDWQGSRFCRR